MVLVSTLVNDMAELLSCLSGFLMKKNECAQFYDLMKMSEQSNADVEYDSFESIEFRNISYRYPLTNRYVIDNVNFVMKKGERIAFVGKNGMGKTTFVKLLSGTLSPSRGDCLVNEIPRRGIHPNKYYDKLSVVVQDGSKYVTFTVGDNVFFGDVDKPRNEEVIDEALSFSGLDNLEKTTLLGASVGGSDLSGGQWKKIAIARAAYRGRDLLILDEPTSNLDPLAEAEIFRKFIALAEEKTVVFVTHRISLASLADRIVVFSEGKIIQDGTHEELISCEGEYSRLFQEQAKWYNR